MAVRITLLFQCLGYSGYLCWSQPYFPVVQLTGLQYAVLETKEDLDGGSSWLEVCLPPGPGPPGQVGEVMIRGRSSARTATDLMVHQLHTSWSTNY